MTHAPVGQPDAGTACVDLHLHSTASDGTASPAAVVAAAVAAGMSAIALTDHDTVAGLPEAQAAASATPLIVIPGVELSAYQGDEEVHVLGLHLSDLATIDAELADFRDARRTRAEQMVQRLNAIGVRITLDDVLHEAREGAIGRPHVAKALVENGYALDLRDAFDRYLGAGRPAFLEKKKLSMRDAIAMIHRVGGLAFLAHPGRLATQRRLADLKVQGLDGAEVLHPSHTQDDRARIMEALRALDMVPTGGSDSHGAESGPRVIGAMRVPALWVELQRARVHLRASGTPA